MAVRIDPYSLRLFVAAAKEGSIARAAAKEHIAADPLMVVLPAGHALAGKRSPRRLPRSAPSSRHI